MGDDATVSREELARIFQRNPRAMETWRKIGVGPQGVRSAGAREVVYRIGAIRHYMTEIRAGAMHVTPFLEAQAKLEASGWGRAAAE